MASTALHREERTGLIVAIAAHAALLVVLVFRPPSGEAILPPQRIEVTLSDNVGLTSTSPQPKAQAAPDIAPDIGEPQPQEQAEPVSQPSPRAIPSPRPEPRPAARPSPKPAARKPAPAKRSSPEKAKPAPKPKPSAHSGGSRIGSDFLKGVRGAQSNGSSRNPAAAEVGPAVLSSLAGAISRQLKPNWIAPQGADAEKLITVLAWNLNKDGSLAGKPRVVRQDGITAANRAQAGRHAEQAIRAVELAAPFDLPPEYYDAWKRVASFRFDKRLSQ